MQSFVKTPRKDSTSIRTFSPQASHIDDAAHGSVKGARKKASTALKGDNAHSKKKFVCTKKSTKNVQESSKGARPSTRLSPTKHSSDKSKSYATNTTIRAAKSKLSEKRTSLPGIESFNSARIIPPKSVRRCSVSTTARLGGADNNFTISRSNCLRADVRDIMSIVQKKYSSTDAAPFSPSMDRIPIESLGPTKQGGTKRPVPHLPYLGMRVAERLSSQRTSGPPIKGFNRTSFSEAIGGGRQEAKTDHFNSPPSNSTQNSTYICSSTSTNLHLTCSNRPPLKADCASIASRLLTPKHSQASRPASRLTDEALLSKDRTVVRKSIPPTDRGAPSSSESAYRSSMASLSSKLSLPPGALSEVDGELRKLKTTNTDKKIFPKASGAQEESLVMKDLIARTNAIGPGESHEDSNEANEDDREDDDDEYEEEEEDEGDEEYTEEESEDLSYEETSDEEDEDQEESVEGDRSRERRPEGRRRHRSSFSVESEEEEESSSRRTLCLHVKVSREGDRNVKLFTIFRNTSFLRFAKEVMWRFRYEDLQDFDMYCIDAAGDHVDIDRKRDFEVLTKPYWVRLKHWQQTQQNAAMANGQAFEKTIGVNNSTTGRQKNKLRGGEDDNTDDGRSTETVIRLYVRDSCNPPHRYGQLSVIDPGKDRLNAERQSSSNEAGAALSSTYTMAKSKAPGLVVEATESVALRRRSLSEPVLPSVATRHYRKSFDPLGSPGGAVESPNSWKSTSSGLASMQLTLQNRRCSFATSFRRANLSGVDPLKVCTKNQIQWTRMGVLGKGSFGTVYEGITTDGKLMAVKVQELPMKDNAEETQSMQSEINLMCSLVHKNIVAYYGCQVINLDNGSRQMEIFLELCHGGTLAQMRQRFDRAKKTFSISLVRSYTHQILEGLAYLHASNVMHRDIKCDNVLISATGEAKLSDFGCSKRMGTTSMMPGANGEARGDKAGAGCTTTKGVAHHTIVGSPLFMAPEVLQSSNGDSEASGGYSMAADIWSVGCLVLELLGREPWDVCGRNIFQLMFHISKATGLPNGVPNNCPAVLLDFFHKCFERDPAKRWTAQQLLQHPWMVCRESELEEVPTVSQTK